MNSPTPAVQVEQPPALDIDQWFADFRAGIRYKLGERPEHAPLTPVHLSADQKAERRIIWNLFQHIQRAGFVILSVWDGEEEHQVTNDPKATMEWLYNLDAAHVYCMKAGGTPALDAHWLYFVFGNSPEEVLSDFNYTEGDPDSWRKCVDAFNAEDFT